MKSQLLLNCHLQQSGAFAGTFCLADGTFLGSAITGVIKKITTLFRYRLPITLATLDEDGNGGQGQASVWSKAEDPEGDHYLQEQLRVIHGCRPQEVKTIIESRSAYKQVQLELDDGRWLLLTVPPTSVPALEQWTERWMHLPVKISAQKTHVTERSVVYLMGFDAAEGPQEQAELRVLAALTFSFQAQQHMLSGLKTLVKGQRKILRQASENFAAQSGLSQAQISAKISEIGAYTGGKP